MTQRKGLDYAAARPPSPEWLPANGYTFVCRYLKILPNSYAITLSEYQGLRAAGVDVCLNWEQNELDFSGGATTGTSYATQAKAQAQALGAWPCPIYFSKDTNTPPNASDTAYLQACARVLGGVQYVGIYGSNAMVQWALENGLATYGWANVWGQPPWYENAHLCQTQPGASVSWGSVDINTSILDDFGQVGGYTGGDDLTPEQAQQLQAVYDWLAGTGNQGYALTQALYQWDAGTGNGMNAKLDQIISLLQPPAPKPST